jgi:hypothetical protein
MEMQSYLTFMFLRSLLFYDIESQWNVFFIVHSLKEAIIQIKMEN